MPHFAQRHHRYIGILFFDIERFIDVLGRGKQFLPVNENARAMLLLLNFFSPIATQKICAYLLDWCIQRFANIR